MMCRGQDVMAAGGYYLQVVMNGLTNAAKYCPDGDTVVALTATITAGGGLLIEVLDSGPGLRGRTLADLSQEFPAAAAPQRVHSGGPGLPTATAPARRQSSAFNRVRAAAGEWHVFDGMVAYVAR